MGCAATSASAAPASGSWVGWVRVVGSADAIDDPEAWQKVRRRVDTFTGTATRRLLTGPPRSCSVRHAVAAGSLRRDATGRDDGASTPRVRYRRQGACPTATIRRPRGPLVPARRRARADRGSAATSPGSRRSAGSRSTATTTPGAGRSTSRARSGSRSGTTSASGRRRRPGRPSPTRACPAPAGSRAPRPQLRRARARAAGRGRPATSSSSAARRRATAVDAHRGRAARRGRAAAGPGCPRSASGAATAWPRSCPTSPRRSSALLATAIARRRLVVLRAGVRDAGRGRPVRPDRAHRAARRRRLPLRRPGRSTGRRRWPRSAPRCRPSAPRSSSPTCDPSRRRGGHAGRGAVVAARSPTTGAARLRPGPVRPPAVRAVLVGHHRACPSRSSTATAASCSSTSRRSRCTRTSGPATASAGSPRPAG